MFTNLRTAHKLTFVVICCLLFCIPGRPPRLVSTEMETTKSGHFRWLFAMANGSRQILDSNDHGKPFDITLPDGSTVKLNFGSSLRYPAVFDSRTRNVILDGEAAFDIAHNGGGPFIVHTRSVAALVLGTTFDIQAYDSEPVEITLISGSLEVVEGIDTERLQPSEQAVLDDGRLEIHVLHHPREYLSWADLAPYLHFEDKDLGTVVRHLARWYGLKVANPGHVPGTSITGNFPLSVSADVNLKFVNDAERYAAHISRSGNTFFIESHH